jgi:cell division protein ZapA
MAQVTITIDGKQFRMACEDGQEPHLEGLATHLEGRVKMMRESFGEIGDLRLTVMAALMIADEYFEEKRKIDEMQFTIERERLARGEIADGTAQRDAALAGAIDGLTSRIERITRVLAAAPGEV